MHFWGRGRKMADLREDPTRSSWLEELPNGPLQGKHDSKDAFANDAVWHTDVVVVGAGLTGIFTAYWLAKITALRVVVLEGRCIAGGATGRNGGHLWPQDAAEEQTAEEMQRLIAEWDIDCELVRAGSVSFNLAPAPAVSSTTGASHTEVLEAADLRQRMGMNETTYGGHGGTLYTSACRIWPAKLVRAIADRLQHDYADRIRIVEQAIVENVTDGEALSDTAAQQCVVQVSGGRTIHCQHVVVATNGWTSKLLPELRDWIFPCRNQVVCTAPLSARWQHGVAYGRGANEMYGIQRSDGRVILGGARAEVPGLEIGNSDDSTLDPRPSAALREFLNNCFPGEEVVVQREWAGIMGFTRDGLPLVGPVPGRPNIFVAAGYNGHGMPKAHRAARAVARMIKGQEHLREIFTSEHITDWSSQRVS